MLSQTQIEFYNENGYLTVDKVLSDSEVIDLQKVTDEFVIKSGAYTDHTDIFDLEPGHTSDCPKLRRIKEPIDHHSVYAKTIRNNNILNIVEKSKKGPKLAKYQENVACTSKIYHIRDSLEAWTKTRSAAVLAGPGRSRRDPRNQHKCKETICL